MDVHEVDGLAGIDARRNELALTLAPPFFRIVGRHDLAIGVEQIALAVPFEDRAEVPAVAVIIGELGVLELGIEVIDIAQEIQIAPFAARGRALGIAFQDGMSLLEIRIFLLLGPHLRRVRFIVPHGVAQVAVQEHIGLVHVAGHALRGGDRAGEDMA